MANLPDGTYIIRNAASPYYALDVLANQTVNGTNVQIWARNNTDAQIWSVTTRRDGTRQILNRFSGKSIDVLAANISVAGTNVQLFDDNDTIAQQWSIIDASSTISTGGTTYNCFYIRVNSGKEATAASATEGANVSIQNASSSSYHKWFFEPVPLLRDGGVYEIRTYLNTKMGLEVVGGTANGANIQLNYASDKNTMKFVLAKESTGWSFYNAATGKYIDVDSALAVAGTNVQQWDDNDTRAQRWKIITYGDTTVGGVKCLTCRLGSYVTSDGQTFMMDVSKSDSSAGNNVQIWGALNNDAQLFVLVPTSAEDVSMPVPYDIGVCEKVKGPSKTPFVTTSLTNKIFYPSWQCSAAWAADGNNHYQMRWRYRYIQGTSNTWKNNSGGNDWSSYTSWQDISVTKEGTRSWYTKGFECDYDFQTDNCKLKQYEIQVRAVGTDEYSKLHSKTASKTVSIFRKPVVGLIYPTLTPEGFRLPFINYDYPYGTTYVTITQIVGEDDGKQILKSPVRLELQSYRDSDLIEIDKLTEVPEITGTYKNFRFYYKLGYDLCPDLGILDWWDIAVLKDGGNYQFTPELIEDGLRLYAVVPSLGNTRVWVNDGKKLLECPQTQDYTPTPSTTVGITNIAFDIPYAMGKENTIIVSTVSDDETKYGIEYVTWSNDLIAHAFTTEDGHTVFLHKFVGAMPTMSKNRSSVYESNVLDARVHESISFNGTVKSTITAYGDLLKPDDYSSIEDFEELEGKHAIFRDLYGDIWQVAITSVYYERHEEYDHVTVSMIEETI